MKWENALEMPMYQGGKRDEGITCEECCTDMLRARGNNPIEFRIEGP